MRLRKPLLWLCIVGVAGGVAACRPPAPAVANPAPLDRSSPQAVVRSLIHTLRERQRAVAQNARPSAKAYHLAAAPLVSDRAVARYKPAHTRPGDDRYSDEKLALVAITDWGATLGYYLEGIHLEAVPEVAGDGDIVPVVVNASSPLGGQLIRFDCVRAGAAWSVNAVHFVRPQRGGSATTTPATTPAE